ncbi:hypothetical protein D3C72_1037470 [compost metagenome]
MHGQDLVPLLVGHFLDDVVPGVAGVVDDDIDATKAVHGGFDEAVGEVCSGDATHTGDGVATGSTNLGDHFFGRSGIQVIDHDFRAVTGQLQGDATTDATTGTGHQGYFSFKLSHCSALVSY